MSKVLKVVQVYPKFILVDYRPYLAGVLDRRELQYKLVGSCFMINTIEMDEAELHSLVSEIKSLNALYLSNLHRILVH